MGGHPVLSVIGLGSNPSASRAGLGGNWLYYLGRRVLFAAMIPSFLMSPVSGYLADRFDRRTILVYAYSLNLSHNLLLAVLVATGSIEPWHLVVLAVVNGSARSSQMPPAPGSPSQ